MDAGAATGTTSGVTGLGLAIGGMSARRVDILRAALGLFAERGYRSTTMDEIAAELDLRGPSLYKHVSSKQDLLAELMLGTMERLQGDLGAAVATAQDPVDRLRRAVESHVRYHARHRLEAFIGNRELANVEGDRRAELLAARRRYERSFRALVQEGVDRGVFEVPSVKLASYALLDMGIGVAVWFRDDGELTVEEIAQHYGDLAMRLVGRCDREAGKAFERAGTKGTTR